MTKFSVQTTNKKEVFDITDTVNSILKHKNAGNGVVHILVNHTTCALTIINLDRENGNNFLNDVKQIFPNIQNFHETTVAALIGYNLSIPVKENEVVLGETQRIVLVELSGPHDRKIILSFTADAILI